MSNFFDSELIQEELEDISELQKFIYKSVLTFGSMSLEDKKEHIDKMSLLLEKQQIMYTRLSLSDDPQAIEMKENLKKSVLIMGFPPDTDLNLLFNSMKKTIDSLKKFIDK
jgi:agmatine/peptidylarginine deiminase